MQKYIGENMPTDSQDATQESMLSREYAILLDSLDDGIWVIDGKGITLRINKAMERIAGIRAVDVVGRHVSEPVAQGLYENCVTLHALEEKRTVTMFDNYANGKRCLNTSTPVFDDRGDIWRIIASVRDMTELEELQCKLAASEQEAKSYKMDLEYLEAVLDDGFVGYSPSMQRLRRDVAKAAKSEAITLILGETGTGKSHAARVIHQLGERHDKPFLPVNCGAIPLALMESEMFGYEKGAFTGAAQGGKRGMFELAHQGTLLLDEISELPLPLQAKLLHVLDGHPFQRVGGTRPIETDVRVIAASNKSLEQMVKEGTFREDLFYRLRVLTVDIPPLRERQSDIPVLIMYFLDEIRKKSGVSKRLDPRVLDVLLAHTWPGNVRELRSLVQSLATMSDNEVIMLGDLPAYMRPVQRSAPTGHPALPLSLTDAVEDLERRLIMTALEESGSTYKAAARLKVSQSTLFRKARRYGIPLANATKRD